MFSEITALNLDYRTSYPGERKGRPHTLPGGRARELQLKRMKKRRQSRSRSRGDVTQGAPAMESALHGQKGVKLELVGVKTMNSIVKGKRFGFGALIAVAAKFIFRNNKRKRRNWGSGGAVPPRRSFK